MAVVVSLHHNTQQETSVGVHVWTEGGLDMETDTE